MQTENKKGFQVKDLIVTALLSLCALVIYILYGFYPPMIICCIIAGIISALIAWKTGCTNGKTLTISYIIYMVLAAFSGTYIPFLFFSNQTLEQYAGMFGESYLGILQTLVSPVTAIIMLVVVAICAFVGALNAKKLLKKHGGLFRGCAGTSATKGLCSLRRCGGAFGCKKAFCEPVCQRTV